MPSEMYERGKRDAEADTLDESFYQYYYDYRLAYDAVMRMRRRGHAQVVLARIGRVLLRVVPVIFLAVGSIVAYQHYVGNAALVSLARPTATVTIPATPRPTLPPPTAIPTATPPPPLVLRTDGFAVVTGTQNTALLGRQAPGRRAPVTARFSPGKRLQIVAGPEQADGLTWWRVKGDQGEGWSAADYLSPVSAEQ